MIVRMMRMRVKIDLVPRVRGFEIRESAQVG